MLDTKYPTIIDRCREAIDMLMPASAPGITTIERVASKYSLCSKHWPCLFPQHGPGKKHTRRIAVEPWQQALIDQRPRNSSSD